jgi:RHS repeat-associated protein
VIECNEQGQVISYEEYYAYGKSAYRAAASGVDLSLKRYRFTNKERDNETGLDYFGVRYYASWLGRWISADPGGFVDGLNLYRYARNNPVNGVDREGYATEPPPEDCPDCPPNNTYSWGGGDSTGSINTDATNSSVGVTTANTSNALPHMLQPVTSGSRNRKGGEGIGMSSVVPISPFASDLYTYGVEVRARGMGTQEAALSIGRKAGLSRQMILSKLRNDTLRHTFEADRAGNRHLFERESKKFNTGLQSEMAQNLEMIAVGGIGLPLAAGPGVYVFGGGIINSTGRYIALNTTGGKFLEGAIMSYAFQGVGSGIANAQRVYHGVEIDIRGDMDAADAFAGGLVNLIPIPFYARAALEATIGVGVDFNLRGDLIPVWKKNWSQIAIETATGIVGTASKKMNFEHFDTGGILEGVTMSQRNTMMYYDILSDFTIKGVEIPFKGIFDYQEKNNVVKFGVPYPSTNIK